MSEAKGMVYTNGENDSSVDCNLATTNVGGLGEVFTITSSGNSEDSSITVAQAAQYIQSKGTTVTSITDINGNELDLTSNDLIGTGTIISTANGDYPVVVYGDATGDGEINAADMNVVVQSFLGNISNLPQIVQTAADVQQDGEINAADISQMINSFLGNLSGSILKVGEGSTEPEISTFDAKTLSSVAKVGDYVNYPVSFINEINDWGHYDNYVEEQNRVWRVMSINDNKIELLSDKPAYLDFPKELYGWPMYETASQYLKYIESNQTTLINNIKCTYDNDESNTNNMVYSKYAESARIFEYEDAQKILGKVPVQGTINNDLISGSRYAFTKIIKTETGYYGHAIPYGLGIKGNEFFDMTFSDTSAEYGVHKIVVDLKNGIKTNAGDGTKTAPWQLVAQ